MFPIVVFDLTRAETVNSITESIHLPTRRSHEGRQISRTKWKKKKRQQICNERLITDGGSLVLDKKVLNQGVKGFLS